MFRKISFSNVLRFTVICLIIGSLIVAFAQRCNAQSTDFARSIHFPDTVPGVAIEQCSCPIGTIVVWNGVNWEPLTVPNAPIQKFLLKDSVILDPETQYDSSRVVALIWTGDRLVERPIVKYTYHWPVNGITTLDWQPLQIPEDRYQDIWSGKEIDGSYIIQALRKYDPR